VQPQQMTNSLGEKKARRDLPSVIEKSLRKGTGEGKYELRARIRKKRAQANYLGPIRVVGKDPAGEKEGNVLTW